MDDVNVPMALVTPSIVLLFEMVGFAVVLQQKPYCVMGSPNIVIVPFAVAVVWLILLAACVVIVGPPEYS